MNERILPLLIFTFLFNLQSKSQTNPSGAVGMISSSQSIQPDGSFNYTIPIDIPYGAGGLTPKISASYNSQIDLGLFGYGWNLMGIPTITRVGNDMFHDGVITPVKFTTQDKLSLNGNRLVISSGNYLSNNAIYKTENESYSRIETVTDNGIVWFKVIQNDGSIQEFGSSSTSRYTPPGTTTTYQWWLRKVSDPNGNYYEIEYLQENGMIYPTKIIYSKNNTVTTTGLIVEFTYKNSTMPRSYFISGAKVVLGKIATEIAIKSNGTLLRKYSFKYNPQCYTKDILQEISLEGNNGIKLPPTTFNWEPTTLETDTITTNLTLNNACVGDFDGNSKNDIARVTGTTLEIFSWENNQFIQNYSTTIPSGVVNILAPDLDSDGRSDIVLDYTNASTGATRCRFYQNIGGAFISKLDTVLAGYSTSIPMQFGDINGDGKPDMVWAGNSYLNFWEFSNFSSLFTPKANILGSDAFSLCDFNGDGIKDVFLNKRTPAILYYSNGTVTSTNLDSSFPLLTQYYPGDYNGDGLTDLFYYDKNTKRHKIKLNNGVSFTETMHFDYVYTTNLPTINIADFNGDGAEDIILKEEYPATKTILYSPLNETTEYEGVRLNVDPSRLGDFDGDGYTELITSSKLIKLTTQNNAPKILSVNRGDGFAYTINYTGSSNSNVCLRNFNCSYPIQNFAQQRYLVSRITTPNGIGGENYSTYTYSNPRYHITGLGFIGFEKFSVYESSSQTLIEEQFNFNNSKYLPLLTERNTYIGGAIVNRDVYSYTFIYPSVGNYAVRPTNITSEDYVKGTTINKNLQYNSNAILVEETGNRGGFVTQNKYSNHTGKNVGYYPGTIETSYSLNGNNAKTDITTFLYTANYRVASKDFNSGTSAGFTNSYVYDSFGNVIETSETGSGITKTNKFTYSSDGRFLVKATNPLNQTEEYFYNISLGTLTYQTDINGYRTDYTYDGFENLISAKQPNGITTTTTSSWAINEKGNSVWKKTTTTEGSASITEWFDIFGRPVYAVSSAPNSKEIHKSYSYNAKGELTSETLPEFSAPSSKLVAYSYDTYGRLISKNALGKSVSISYSGNSVTETNEGISTTTSYNAIGLPVAVSGGNGSVTFLYNGAGQPTSVSAEGATTTYSYNYSNNQVTVTNPNSGTTTTTTNAWGQPISITDARGLTSQINYDILGRPISKTLPEGNVNYTYDTQINGALSAVTFNGHTRTFSYNTAKYGRLQGIVDIIDGNSFGRTFNYDDNNYGRLQSVVYPNSFSIAYNYDSNGFCTSIAESNGNLIWSRGSETALGQPLNYTLGNGLTQTYQYNNNAALEKIEVNGIYSQSYSFDPATGNLLLRKDNLRQLTETFEYDGAHRLNTITGPQGTQTLSYTPNGNITNKYDAGDYSYTTIPHAVTEIAPYSASAVPTLRQNLTYSSFNKPILIAVGAMQDSLVISYGVDLERVVEKTYKNNTLAETRYILGDYELVKTPGEPNKHICYINSPYGIVAVNIDSNQTSGNLHYLHTDHLGSLVAVTNTSGALEEEMSYDAWGHRRNPNNWEYDGFSAPTIINRGYTFHQHYDQLGLINMNGRVYDPVVARFLGVDPLVVNPLNAQDYNGYSYCTNNPLRYNDPSGYTYLEAMKNSHSYDGDSFWYRGQYITNVGGVFYGESGQRYGSIGTGYSYDWASNTYSHNGQHVSFWEVYYNCIQPTSLSLFSKKTNDRLINFQSDENGFALAVENEHNGYYLAFTNDIQLKVATGDVVVLGNTTRGGVDWWATTGNLADGVLLGVDLFLGGPTGESIPAIAGRKTLWNSLKSWFGGGKTFAQFKAAKGGTQTLMEISTSTGVQRISTEFHHVFISQQMQRTYNLPNWLVNNSINVWKLNTVQHSLIDSYRFNFLRAGFKSDVGWFGKYSWFTKF